MSSDLDTVIARLPPELELTDGDMSLKWKLWKQAFEFYAIATQLSKKPAEVQAAVFMSAIGPAAISIFNTFGLSDEDSKNVDVIKRKFDNHFSHATATQLSKKAEEVKAAVFMSAIGHAAITIHNTFGLSEEDIKNLDVIKRKIDNHFSPNRNETYIRYLFFTCVQGTDEPFDSYLTKLRTKVDDCAFGEQKDGLLRDQIVRGICSDKVRESLLAEKDLTLSKTIDICREREQAFNQAKAINVINSEM